MEGVWGRKFFAREPKRKPRRPRIAEQRNFLFLLEEKSGARKIRKAEKTFLLASAPNRAGGGAGLSFISLGHGGRGVWGEFRMCQKSKYQKSGETRNALADLI